MSDTVLPPIPEPKPAVIVKLGPKVYLPDQVLKETYFDCSGLITSATNTLTYGTTISFDSATPNWSYVEPLKDESFEE